MGRCRNYLIKLQGLTHSPISTQRSSLARHRKKLNLISTRKEQSSKTMELPHIGKHCSLQSCSKLDFLPFKCDACNKIFCDEHYTYQQHNCSESYVKNVVVPQCPLCDCPIPVKRGEDPNIRVNEHISKDCKVPMKKKMYDKRCSFTGCKRKELVPIVCNRCHLNFCIQHRLETDHKCQGPAPKYTSVFGGTQQKTAAKKPSGSRDGRPQQRQPQSSFMSHSGAELDRMRQARLAALQAPQQRHPAQPASMSENEALAFAIAQSLDQQTQTSSSRKSPNSVKYSTDTPPNGSGYNEDEALAQAIAASLQEQETSQQKNIKTNEQTRKSRQSSEETSSCTVS